MAAETFRIEELFKFLEEKPKADCVQRKKSTKKRHRRSRAMLTPSYGQLSELNEFNGNCSNSLIPSAECGGQKKKKKVILSVRHQYKSKSRCGRKKGGKKSKNVKPCSLDQPYVQNMIGELWKHVDPDIGENMRKLMETEFGLKKREAEEYVINQKMNLLNNKHDKKKGSDPKRLPCFPFPPLRPQPPKTDFFCPMKIPQEPCSPCSSPCPPPQPCWPPDFIVELQRLLCQQQAKDEGKAAATSGVISSAENLGEDEEEGGEGEGTASESGKIEPAKQEDCRPPDILDILTCMLSPPPPCPPRPCSPPPTCPPTNLVAQLKEMLYPTCPPSTSPSSPCPPPDIMCAIKEMFCPSTCPSSPCPPCTPAEIMQRLLCQGEGGTDIPIPQIPPDCPCPPPNYQDLLREYICPPPGPAYPCTSYIVKRPKRRKIVRKSQGLRYYWFKEMTDLLMLKLNDYVAMMLSTRRPRRARCIAESILKTLCDITGEKCTLNQQKTRAQKMLVFLADRIALWLTKLTCECDELRRELVCKKDAKNVDDSKNGSGDKQSDDAEGPEGDPEGAEGGDSESPEGDSEGRPKNHSGPGRSQGPPPGGSGGNKKGTPSNKPPNTKKPGPKPGGKPSSKPQDKNKSGGDKKKPTTKPHHSVAITAGEESNVDHTSASVPHVGVKHEKSRKAPGGRNTTKLGGSKVHVTKSIRGRHTITNKKNRSNKSGGKLKSMVDQEMVLQNLAERKQFNEVLTNIINAANLTGDTTRSKDVAKILQTMIEEQIRMKQISLTENTESVVKTIMHNIAVWIDELVTQAEREYLLSIPQIRQTIRLHSDSNDRNAIIKYIESETEAKPIDQLKEDKLFIRFDDDNDINIK